MTYDVSVIVTVRQEDTIALLESCIQSVQHQTAAVKEVIVVDDSQRYDIFDLVQSLSSQFGNIKYVNENDGKANLNLAAIGIQLAQQEWVAFIRPSEVWLPDKLEHQLAALEQFSSVSRVMVLSDCYMGNLNADVPGLMHCFLYSRRFDIAHAKYAMLLEYEPWLLSGILLRRALALEIADKYEVQNEWVFFWRLLQSADLILVKYADYIHKILEPRQALQEYYEALPQLKQDILFHFGLSYWNDVLRMCCNYAQRFQLPELHRSFCNLLDFGSEYRIEVGAIEKTDSCFFRRETKCLHEFCSSHRFLACYGAGKFATNILSYLLSQQVPIGCVIVSDGQKKASSLNGIQIYERSKFDLSQIDGMILAMDLKKFPTMKMELQTDYSGDIFTVTHSFYSFLRSAS